MRLVDTRRDGAGAAHAGTAATVDLRAEPLRLERRAAAPVESTGSGDAQALPAAYSERLATRYREGYEQGREEGERSASQAFEAAQRDKGFEQGREEGLADGRRAAAAEFEQKLARLEALLRALPAQVEARLAATEDDMAALCFETVVKMAGQGAVRAGAVRQVLRDAMAQLNGGTAALHVHPDDLALLKEEPGFGEWMAQAGGAGEVPRLVADKSLRLGGVLLRAANANLDARLDTQLQSFKALLLQTRKEERARRAPGAGGAAR